MIALIATVLNEGESLHRLMTSIISQTRQPDEVVIVDGGSQDNTVALLQSYADRLLLRVIVLPGCNISQGRNRAIQEAQAEIIAVTDAGVELAADWLEQITGPLVTDRQVMVVSGFFHPQYTTPFERAMSATVLPLVDEVNPDTFLPSSRSIAFRKAAWEAVGGYPEWFDYCEDLILDLRLKQWCEPQPFTFEPGALVYFRPRGSWTAFYKQYYRYARGDGKADLWRKRHAARYLTYLVAIPIIVGLGWWLHPLLWLLLLPGAFVYLRQPYRRLGQLAPVGGVWGRIKAIILIPFIRAVGDVAKMLGYPVGWVWRLRHHPPDWKRL